MLLYGPDGGLVAERAETAVAAVAGRRDDPFLVTELAAGDLKDDPARLLDEAATMALGGGRRAVRLRGAGDGASRPIAAALEALGPGGSAPALIIIEAGELGPRSSLRKLFEGTERAAAIACYLDEGDGLERVIDGALKSHGLKPTAEARAWLAANLGADRRMSMSELEKLSLYCASAEDVTVADCQAIVGDAATSELDDAIFATGSGDLRALETALGRAFQEGANPIAVLRAAQRHFQRLHLAAGAVAQGASPDAAMKALKPPVFFKLATRFRSQIHAWPAPRAASALGILVEAEFGCKMTGRPGELICRRALMQIGHAARRGRG
jgi:DNA polymerase-3 subunit delta